MLSRKQANKKYKKRQEDVWHGSSMKCQARRATPCFKRVKARFSSHLNPFKLIASSIISDRRTGNDFFFSFEDHLVFGQHNKSSNVTDRRPLLLAVLLYFWPTGLSSSVPFKIYRLTLNH